MKRCNYLMIISLFIVMFAGCKKDDDLTDYAIATASWGKLSLTLDETGVVTNVWVFNTLGSTGQATLTGVGDYAYTYVKEGVNKSTIVFTIQGSDKYELTWTGELKGTLVESFNGLPGNTGTFTIVKQ
jgi:hypothetical protein